MIGVYPHVYPQGCTGDFGGTHEQMRIPGELWAN